LRAGRDCGYLRETQRQWQAYVDAPNIDQYAYASTRFRGIIVCATGSAQLTKLIRTVKGQIRVLNAASARLPGKAGNSITEHYIIVIEAIEKGDGAQVVELEPESQASVRDG
jgi:DNA-binding GntR family transcriptional regulator